MNSLLHLLFPRSTLKDFHVQANEGESLDILQVAFALSEISLRENYFRLLCNYLAIDSIFFFNCQEVLSLSHKHSLGVTSQSWEINSFELLKASRG